MYSFLVYFNYSNLLVLIERRIASPVCCGYFTLVICVVVVVETDSDVIV